MRATAITQQPARLQSVADRVEVAPGVMMPRLGLGTSHALGMEAARAIFAAFRIGYRLVDTSANYLNEEYVGRAIAESDLAREDLFITTKLEGPDQGRRTPIPALEASLHRLGLEYVDLYLIHWPNPELTNETWSAMEEIQRRGLSRAIGVSNFEISDLEQLQQTAEMMPAVNQVRYNPIEYPRELHEYCARLGITMEAWAPIIRGQAGLVRTLADIARKHGKTAEQVSLRWLLQKGVIAIPKSVHESRLRENADLYDFELSAEEMSAIDSIPR